MFNTLIYDICKELNIKCTSFSNNWGLCLEKDGETHLIMGTKFDLNNHAAGIVADDKYALYELLKLKNIPIIEHMIMYSPDNTCKYALSNNSFKKANDYFRENNCNIVIKPNDGSCGNGVEHITNVEELQTKIVELFRKDSSISLCPFYDIETEYRVIILKGICECIYGKKKPIVYGNGINNVKELLIEFNPCFFNDDNRFFNRNIDLNYIPKSGEKIEYNWKFNLAKGARIEEDIEETKKNKIIKIALDAYNASNLHFCSVDVIETSNNEMFIIEINSGVTINRYVNLATNGYEKARLIYKKAIIEMFRQ